ncbi:MAG: hypothetical protein ACJ73S_27685, partial [Mycobacteriales bacterium]
MRETERADDHDRSDDRQRAATESDGPGPGLPGILALQRAAGNAAVGRLLGRGRPAVQRQATGGGVPPALQARAQQQIDAAKARQAPAGGAAGGQQEGEPAAPPSPEAVAAERAKQRAAMSGTVDPPDTSGSQSEARTAADAAK